MKNVTIILALFATVVSYANAQTPSFTYFFDSLSREALQPLKQEIGNARYVFLGEPDHNQGNIFTAKIEVMKMLHEEMDFDIIAFESGFYDLNKSHEAIVKGESIKYAYMNSIFDTWTAAKEFHPFMDYVTENYDELKVVGFDSQLSGYYVDETLEEDFGSFFDSQEAYIEWSNYIEHLQDYQFPKSLDYDDFVSKNQTLKEAILYSNQPNKEDLLRTLTFLEGSAYDYYFNGVADKTEETFEAKDSNGRDKMMADNFLYLTQKYPNKKIIVWGATGHLMNSVKGALEELDAFVPMGSIVKEQLGSQVYTLAFTGKNTAYKTDNNIEDHFFKTGKAYGFLNLKEGDIFQSNVISTEGGEIETLETDWSKVVDGLFFVSQLKSKTFQPYDCGESQLEQVSVFESETKDTKFSFTLEESDSTGQNIPSYYFKDSKSINRVKGVVYNQKTKEPIPYANIITSKSRRGTSSNSVGLFGIALPMSEDSLIISSIGYQSTKIAPNSNNLEIYLKPKVEEMTTLTISSEPLTAKGIMKKVIKNIPKNYNQEPYTRIMEAETLYKSPFDTTETTYYFHQILDYYDDNGYESAMMFPIRYKGFIHVLSIKACELDSLKNNPIPFRKPQKIFWGFGHFGMFDMVDLRYNNFLNQGKMSKYQFEFSDVLVENGKEIFVIKLSAKSIGYRSSTFDDVENLNGTLYINAEDYSIQKIELYVVYDHDSYEKGIAKALKYNYLKFETVTFTKRELVYKKHGDGYYYIDSIIEDSNIPIGPSHYDIKVKEIKTGFRPKPEKEIEGSRSLY